MAKTDIPKRAARRMEGECRPAKTWWSWPGLPRASPCVGKAGGCCRTHPFGKRLSDARSIDGQWEGSRHWRTGRGERLKHCSWVKDAGASVQSARPGLDSNSSSTRWPVSSAGRFPQPISANRAQFSATPNQKALSSAFGVRRLTYRLGMSLRQGPRAPRAPIRLRTNRTKKMTRKI
jgi:hypothetical protein